MSRFANQIALVSLSLFVAACGSERDFEEPGGGDPGASPDAGPGGTSGAGGAGGGGDMGGVSSDAEWPVDPCATPESPPPGYQLIKLGPGNNVVNLSDRPGNQMIVAGAGNDTIYAGPGDDIICAGPGRDLVYGQEGDDYIDGGYANDTLYGNNGFDVIHGRAGSDTIYGGGGWDTLFGDILDDRIFGGPGNDLIVGGHGADFMHGQEGDDWLRGDTNGDQFVGGIGTDVASFMTATPPGQAGFGPNPPEGIDADVTLAPGQECSGKNPSNLNQDIDYPGCAWGDGRDGLMGIEILLGSPFDDAFAGGAGVNHFYGGYGNDSFRELEAADQAVGGPGQDLCNGAPCDEAGEQEVVYPIVFVDARPRDLGLVVLGGEGDDAVTIERNGSGVLVTEQSGGSLSVGAHCRHPDPANTSEVYCDIPHSLRYVLGWGGGGNDTITIGNNFPRDFTAHLDGGPGDDVLSGGPGEDVILAGVSGNDRLYGNAGSDALITESTDGDLLDAGHGNDQLVSNYPCGGHTYLGGPGQDIAGFARAGYRYRVKAQLGGATQNATSFHGRAFSPGTCGDSPASWTVLHPGLEVLEGTSLNDVLYGNDAPNVIWGRAGDDLIRGYGGSDVLEGIRGNDTIYGGPGRDILRGGAGYDEIHAADGVADRLITCGSNGGRLMTADPNDPPGSGCN